MEEREEKRVRRQEAIAKLLEAEGETLNASKERNQKEYAGVEMGEALELPVHRLKTDSCKKPTEDSLKVHYASALDELLLIHVYLNEERYAAKISIVPYCADELNRRIECEQSIHTLSTREVIGSAHFLETPLPEFLSKPKMYILNAINKGVDIQGEMNETGQMFLVVGECEYLDLHLAKRRMEKKEVSDIQTSTKPDGGLPETRLNEKVKINCIYCREEITQKCVCYIKEIAEAIHPYCSSCARIHHEKRSSSHLAMWITIPIDRLKSYQQHKKEELEVSPKILFDYYPTQVPLKKEEEKKEDENETNSTHVMWATSCTKMDAVEALQKSRGDIVGAILLIKEKDHPDMSPRHEKATSLMSNRQQRRARKRYEWEQRKKAKKIEGVYPVQPESAYVNVALISPSSGHTADDVEKTQQEMEEIAIQQSKETHSKEKQKRELDDWHDEICLNYFEAQLRTLFREMPETQNTLENGELPPLVD